MRRRERGLQSGINVFILPDAGRTERTRKTPLPRRFRAEPNADSAKPQQNGGDIRTLRIERACPRLPRAIRRETYPRAASADRRSSRRAAMRPRGADCACAASGRRRRTHRRGGRAVRAGRPWRRDERRRCRKASSFDRRDPARAHPAEARGRRIGESRASSALGSVHSSDRSGRS